MAHTPEDIWAEMRLHMEWSEGFSLCVLFSPGASATEQIVQWADDAWAWRTAPMTRLNPAQANGAARAVLNGLHQHQQRWGKLCAPVWVEMLSHDAVDGPASWDMERTALMALLNESREWLLREFSCPLVLCLPTTWALRVPTLAPDLWHVRSFTAEVAAAWPMPTVSANVQLTSDQASEASDAWSEQLTSLRQAVQVARDRAQSTNNHQQPAALREWVMALWALSEHALAHSRSTEAHAAASESVALMRQLHTALGDSPQVLLDLSVSLEQVGDAENQAGRGEAALQAYRESLDLRRQLRTALGDSPQVLRDLSVSLDNVGDAENQAGRGEAALLAYRESLDLCRQLRTALGDSPQVLRDLSVSLNKLGDAENQAGRSEAALQAYRESLELCRELRTALGDSPQVLDDLAVSLERCGTSDACPITERQALLAEAVALRERLVKALQSDHHRYRLDTTLALQLRYGVDAPRIDR